MRSSSIKQPLVKLTDSRREAIGKLLGIDHETAMEGGVFEYINEFCTLIGLLLMDSEVESLCGRKHERRMGKEGVRWGHQPGKILVQGQMMPVNKPRVRTSDARTEMELATYQELKGRDVLNSQMAQKLIVGLSTRNYGKIIDKVLGSTSLSRQTVSRRAKEEMSKTLHEFRERSIEHLDITAILIDGISLADRVHIVALGIDNTGKKHVLGMEQGSTENSGVCRALIANLFERGLCENQRYLFVIDGSKALRKALKDVFGDKVEIQRCKEHKKRNVMDKLAKKHHNWFRQRFEAAYNIETYSGCSRAFQQLRGELSMKSESATNSLIEGLEELLTLHRLEVKGTLRQSLSSTNCIESMFASARYYMRNVKRWRKEIQMERWLAAGLLHAEQGLRRVRGHTRMNQLTDALKN